MTPPGEDHVEDHWQEVVLACWRRGQQRSAVGPGPVEPHLAHATALAEHLLPDDAVGLDLGTGAGLPGLALAGLRPDMRWILLDAARRRVQLVAEAVDALGWGTRVVVVHGRAEDTTVVAPRSVDVVVARLFGPPSATAECAAPLLRPGGRLLVTEPPEPAAGPPEPEVGSNGERWPAEPEVGSNGERWPADGLAVLGLELGRRFRAPLVQELVATASPEDRFPRQPGVAVRRPLW